MFQFLHKGDEGCVVVHGTEGNEVALDPELIGGQRQRAVHGFSRQPSAFKRLATNHQCGRLVWDRERHGRTLPTYAPAGQATCLM